MRISKRIFNYIEEEMYGYDDIKRELELYKEEVLHGTSRPEVSVRAGNGDITASKAIKMTSSKYVIHCERVIRAVDKSLARLTDEHRELFRLKYQKGYHWKEVAVDMSISDRKYFRLRRELVTMVGKELGVINIE